MARSKIDKAAVEAEMRRRKLAISSPSITKPVNPLDWIRDEEVTIEDPHKASTNAIIRLVPWPEQVKYINLLHTKQQTIILKARQLGVSWMTIVYCVWLCIFHSNVQVLVFSKDKEAAEEIIRRARGVFSRLRNKPVIERGKTNTKTINFSNGSRFKAFPATKTAGTSFTATFLIVDEADKMEFGKKLYTSIRPTIADGGRIAIIFTAFEEDGMGRTVWDLAEAEGSTITRFFIPWHARPGRTQEWYETEAASAISMAYHKQEYPATPEEALGFTDLDSRLIRDASQWHSLIVPVNEISENLPCVMAIDAGVSSDLFVALTTCWHPKKILPVIRDIKTWNPKLTESKQLDFREPQDWIKSFINTHRVRRIVYDPYQMVSFGQELQRLADAKEFTQGTLRTNADTAFRNRILQGQIGHLGDEDLASHIENTNIKVIADSKRLRLVKRAAGKKIDLAVAASMAIWELVEEFAFSMTESHPISSAVNISQASSLQTQRMFQGMPNSLYRRIRSRYD